MAMGPTMRGMTMKPPRPHDDAFGQALWDYHTTGRDAEQIIERDDGSFGTAGSYSSYFGDPMKQGDGHLLRYVRGRVLDLGCGAGRHALALQQRGCEVVAIDRSPRAIRVCKARGVQKAREMSVTRISRKLGCFDTVIALGNNFGLFGTPRRARWLLARLRKMTTQRGRLVVESRDVYRTDDPGNLAYHRWNRSRGKLAGQMRLRVYYGRHVDPWFEYLMVSPAEMADILDGTGWRIARILKRRGTDASQYGAVIEKA